MVLRPAWANRSLCGTGSNANTAIQFVNGQVGISDKVISCSIIGSEFSSEIIASETISPYDGIKVRVSRE